jgi:hypothetical protein
MGMHLLQLDRYYYRQPNGRLRLKRVSRQVEIRFPRPYRQALAQSPVEAVKLLRDQQGLTLSQAWDRLKQMVNG